MSRHKQLGRLLLISATSALVACVQAPKPLYMWEAFPRQQYLTLLGESAGPEEGIQVMEAHAEKARGAAANLPPGFRAHLGMLHLAAGNASAARQMWQAEKLAFPESAPYMDSLLKRLDASNKTASVENPS